ncbi:serine hydrolase domain-containing protein [Dokdonia sp.]|uniref:serine hydrolase domain-containing protein n=1 Tax=Dokdonia sp. TaxID=2024995 RepID=UPI0032631DAF
MQKYFILIGIIFISFCVSAQTQPEKADLIVESLISENIVVGLVAGYSVDGETKWQSALGYSDRENEKKMELGTITRPASIAKSMTALAVMQLVEQGRIDLDAPIQTYITDYPKQKKTQITTRHLLSHTSGIDGYKNGKETETTKTYATLAKAVDVFKNRKLRFEPGTQFSYTTYGYTVLGLLIEQVSGVTFEEYLQKNIWDKADMNNTGVEKYGVAIPGKSKLYHRDRKGKIKQSKHNNLSNRIPGGGFYITLEDMLKFGNAVLNNTFVSQNTLDLMRQHHSLEKEANAYGFGWFLYNPKPNEGAIIGHSGEQSGSASQLFIIPSTKTVVVILANTALSWKEVFVATAKLMGISQEKE